jgi:hypothetical protein
MGQIIVNDTTNTGVISTANTQTPVAGFWGGISFAANALSAVYDTSNNCIS